MGNIPLATILASSGVMFAGIMGFIYSDLMVPPLVKVNAKYYGWRVALYLAGVMYVSIVITALILHFAFYFTGLTPESTREASEVATFAIDYTFWLNLLALLGTGVLFWLHRQRSKFEESDGGHQHGDSAERSLQDWVTYTLGGALAAGSVAWALT